jgi:ADP-heptose:LPS heptosyltransferase
VPRALDEEPRSVAIVRLRTGLGDLLCTVPALRALRRRLPRARIAIVTFAEMGGVVERMRPYVDELIPFPGVRGIPERPPVEAAFPGFLAQTRARKLDVALQMYGANAAADAVTAALGARRIGGFLAHGDPAITIPYPAGEHEVRRHLLLMRHLGADDGDEALAFPVSRADRLAAPAMAPPYALIHPGATSPSRRWPLERFAAVGDALSARGLGVGIVGTNGEHRLAHRLAARMGAPSRVLAGRTSLGALAALLERAALFVGNDSGPAHVAAAVGTPSVTVFLSGDPVRWAHDARLHRVARADVGCNPCPHLTCPIDHRCARGVRAEAVIEHADALLAGARTIGPCTSSSAGSGST